MRIDMLDFDAGRPGSLKLGLGFAFTLDFKAEEGGFIGLLVGRATWQVVKGILKAVDDGFRGFSCEKVSGVTRIGNCVLTKEHLSSLLYFAGKGTRVRNVFVPASWPSSTRHSKRSFSTRRIRKC